MSTKHHHYITIRKQFPYFLLKFWDLRVLEYSWACIARQALSGEYLIAAVGVDTAENQLPKVPLEFFVFLGSGGVGGWVCGVGCLGDRGESNRQFQGKENNQQVVSGKRKQRWALTWLTSRSAYPPPRSLFLEPAPQLALDSMDSLPCQDFVNVLRIHITHCAH